MIEIDAWRADEEPWRLKRLDLFRQLLEYHEITGVIALYDHKGWLGINWAKKPADIERENADALWEGAFWEPLIDHFFFGVQLTKNVDWGGSPPFYMEETK